MTSPCCSAAGAATRTRPRQLHSARPTPSATRWDEPRTWLKGEYAYLAPNAASLLLARCNLKHDVVDEADLSDDLLAGIARC